MGKKFIILAVLIIGVYCSYAVFHKYFSVTSYIESTTKINLPYGTSTIETYDNWEFAVIGKYEIPESKIIDFCSENNIKSKSSTNYFPLTFVSYLRDTNKPHIQDLKNCLFFSDCSGGNKWNLLLNKTTGEIWFEVSYPDMSGDVIPCEK